MPKPKKPNIFEQRCRAIDAASGWGEEKPKPKKAVKKPAKPVKRGY